MKKIILITMFYGFAAICVSAHATETRQRPTARPPALIGNAVPEVRIDASAIRQRIKEKKIIPLPDAADKFHGEHRSAEDDKGSQK